ncbi:MAG: GNAT family N-acetyltransferase [Lachnospiraceae bacterium]|nr:GNAT family N-acetyltransferase [Lachnospiraceae bacterium]
MKLVLPLPEHREQAIDYIEEFYRFGSEVNGSGALDEFLAESTYEMWLEKLRCQMDIANLPKPRVPGLTYFCVREEDGRIVGMVNIRLALNDFLKNEGGHIGYSVRPTERRKGYGTQILSRALGVCERMGIREVLVSCDRENAASAGVIRNCGGVLQREFYSETFREIIQMYAIRLPDQGGDTDGNSL